MSKDRRLGRGLAALLGSPNDEEGGAFDLAGGDDATIDSPHVVATPNKSPPKPEPEHGELLHLNVYEIDDNPFQPRRDFSEAEIVSLAESLKEHDMLQPILVRQLGERFQLISGERRLRAAIKAGWKTVPAQVREADDRLVAELAIVENLQRKDLNPIEKALSFKRYLDQHSCSQEDFARRLKIDRSTIANLMRLLELPQEVLDALRQGAVTAGHARALLPLGDEHWQVEMCHQIQREGLSVRAVESLVQERIREADGIELDGAAARSPRKQQPRNEQVAALEQELRTALGTKVEIRQASRGRGKIVVHFASHDEFERIRDALSHDAAAAFNKAG